MDSEDGLPRLLDFGVTMRSFFFVVNVLKLCFRLTTIAMDFVVISGLIVVALAVIESSGIV